MTDDLWQRFTNPATQAIQFAQDEAKRAGRTHVGTEHILLGLLCEAAGVAAHVLERLGVSLGRVRTEMTRLGESTKERTLGSTRLTLAPDARFALEKALQEAQELNPKLGLLDFVDTEHLLLGLLHRGAGTENTALRILLNLGADAERLRKEVLHYLNGTLTGATDAAGEPPPLPSLDELRQCAFDAAMRVFHATQSFTTAPDDTLSADLKRVSRQVCTHLARALCPATPEETTRQIRAALNNAAEVQTLLTFAADCNYLPRELAEELQRIYEGLVEDCQKVY